MTNYNAIKFEGKVNQIQILVLFLSPLKIAEMVVDAAILMARNDAAKTKSA